MQTKVYCVKRAITHCDEWYRTRDFNIRTPTERIDAFWLEVEHLLFLMEQAEREGDREAMAALLERIIYYITRIQGDFNIHYTIIK